MHKRIIAAATKFRLEDYYLEFVKGWLKPPKFKFKDYGMVQEEFKELLRQANITGNVTITPDEEEHTLICKEDSKEAVKIRLTFENHEDPAYLIVEESEAKRVYEYNYKGELILKEAAKKKDDHTCTCFFQKSNLSYELHDTQNYSLSISFKLLKDHNIAEKTATKLQEELLNLRRPFGLIEIYQQIYAVFPELLKTSPELTICFKDPSGMEGSITFNKDEFDAAYRKWDGETINYKRNVGWAYHTLSPTEIQLDSGLFHNPINQAEEKAKEGIQKTLRWKWPK